MLIYYNEDCFSWWLLERVRLNLLEIGYDKGLTVRREVDLRMLTVGVDVENLSRKVCYEWCVNNEWKEESMLVEDR